MKIEQFINTFPIKNISSPERRLFGEKTSFRPVLQFITHESASGTHFRFGKLKYKSARASFFFFKLKIIVL